jgi:hypothetical protein
MAQFLLFIQIINQLIPAVRKIVEALNEAFPESGTGETKFNMAMHMATAALDQIEGAKNLTNTLIPLIEPIIRTTADGVKALKTSR